ncbi:MAG: response regulator, partial [Hydrogenovibrio sp.]|uniref:response regulator n=1 Tax=Hydrogenovibrio sp. TaxID=2065821 RepID=UPI002870A251
LLSEAREQADQANNQKSLFLATMSHDIRTPMYGIMGLSDLGLRVQTQPEKMADCLYKIQHTGQGLLTLLDDILDLSKIEAGELNIQSLPFVFEDLVRSLESQFEPLIQAKNLDFMVRTDPELQAVYRGDSQRLGQVLTNLIGNAVKFTESGFVRLNVYQVRQTNDQASLLFEVEDSGIGMTKSQRTRLFQSFRQGDDSISQTFGGSGLGLKICQDLVGLMDGGAIAVQSHPGIGSIFYFELPMTLCTTQEIRTVQNKARHQAQQKARYELSDFALTGKVLVVEDNVLNQEITVELLERAGLQTCLAENGHRAVSMAFEQKFDLILMDKQMPDLDGYQAARKIREFDDSTPIIALTAAAMHDEREHALAAGLNDYLSKPLDFDRLLSTLANWLGEHKVYLPKVDESSELDGTYESRKNATLYWVDVSTGLRLVGGNKAFYQKMLKAYHQQIEKDFERILKRWDLSEFGDNQAWSEIERAIHSLKGISINLGVDQVVRILESMEVLVIEKQSPDSSLSDEWWSTINVTQEKIEEVIAHFEVDNS